MELVPPVEPGDVDEQTRVKVALSALTLFQSYVQQADAKVNTLLLVHTGGAVAMVTFLRGRDGPHWMIPQFILVMAAFVACALPSAYHIVQALRPRLHAPGEPNPFGFTGITSGAVPGSRASEICAQCWGMARLLGEIALVKNHHVQQATPWTILLLVLGLCTAFSGL